MNAIAKISSAVHFDAIELAIMTSLAAASATAVALYSAPVADVDDSPASYLPTLYAATVRPSK